MFCIDLKTSGSVSFATPIPGDINVWHDKERGIIYVVAEGLLGREELASEMHYFQDSLKVNFVTGDFCILFQLKETVGITPEGFLLLQNFVVKYLNTRYIPVCVALVASSTQEGDYAQTLQKIKELFDEGVTECRIFSHFVDGEDWLDSELFKRM